MFCIQIEIDQLSLNILSALFFFLQCKTRLDTNTSVLSCPSQQKDNYTIIIEIQKKKKKENMKKQIQRKTS